MGVLDKFLDVMKLNGDDDEYDDDFYDEDDDFEDESYEEEKPKKNIFGKKDKPAAYEEEEEDYQLKKSGRSNKVTPMRQPSTRRNAPAMEVCVIKPNAMDDTREITETLLAGRTVIWKVWILRSRRELLISHQDLLLQLMVIFRRFQVIFFW